jgi:hypothetical protein
MARRGFAHFPSSAAVGFFRNLKKICLSLHGQRPCLRRMYIEDRSIAFAQYRNAGKSSENGERAAHFFVPGLR